MLRHHFASVLLERGVSVKAVADFLGHADPGFTLRTYTHLMPSGEDRMRQVIEDPWATGRSASDVPREPHRTRSPQVRSLTAQNYSIR